MKPKKPPVPILDDVDLTSLSKEELNEIPGTLHKWQCRVKDCTHFTRVKDLNKLPMVWWRKKWIDLSFYVFYCGKHWKLFKKLEKEGKQIEMVIPLKPGMGINHLIKTKDNEMKKHEISEQDAKKVISEFPEQEEYINAHLKMFTGKDGEADDNSIELADYWARCKEITEM